MLRKILYVVGIVVILLGIIVYYKLDPSKILLFPKCPFYLLTGLKCPGCGTQRALHQLLHLHLDDACRYNALMVASILVILIVISGFDNMLPESMFKFTIFGWPVICFLFLICIEFVAIGNK